MARCAFAATWSHALSIHSARCVITMQLTCPHCASFSRLNPCWHEADIGTRLALRNGVRQRLLRAHRVLRREVCLKVCKPRRRRAVELFPAFATDARATALGTILAIALVEVEHHEGARAVLQRRHAEPEAQLHLPKAQSNAMQMGGNERDAVKNYNLRSQSTLCDRSTRGR